MGRKILKSCSCQTKTGIPIVYKYESERLRDIKDIDIR